MIEEIKKDILNNSTIHKIKTDDYGNTKRYIHIETEKFYEILDKYNNQDKDLMDENEAIRRIEFEIESALKNKNITIAGRMDIERIKQMQLEKDKYKNAWEELKNDNTEIIEYGNRAVKDCKLYKNKKMYLLEQKYNIGGEE